MSLSEDERKTLVDLYWTKSTITFKEAEIAREKKQIMTVYLPQLVRMY